ncbi:GtrA family protein [Methylibium sp.]|uniref:GtrA family protein n=1 Tax=Methylibium sp. TaxID=2067992 RepID=UPI003D1523FD
MHHRGRRALSFVIVGAVAATVHWLLACAAMRGLAWPPQLANLAGFVLAFGVSYAGHKRYSFRSGARHRDALPRFAVVALSAFSLNGLLYQMLLSAQLLPPEAALALVLLTVAAGTYLASRLWAFRPAPPAP